MLTNAVLTGAVGFSSKRSLIEKFAGTGPVPGSGARRRDQGLDVVSTAFSAAQPPRTSRLPVVRISFIICKFIKAQNINLERTDRISLQFSHSPGQISC